METIKINKAPLGGLGRRMRTMKRQLNLALNRPRIGVTQGGSSMSRGARSAATDGLSRPFKGVKDV